MIRALRAITNNTVNREPEWRRRGRELITGYQPSLEHTNRKPARRVA